MSILDAEVRRRNAVAAEAEQAKVFEFLGRAAVFVRMAAFIFVAWVLEHHVQTIDAIALTIVLILTLRAMGRR